MDLEISAQAETHNLSLPYHKLKENGPILKYNFQQKVPELIENCLYSTLEHYYGPCVRGCVTSSPQNHLFGHG